MSFAGEDLEVPLPPPLFTADEVECSKECCRGVLEEVDERDISKQAWEDVTVCLARASVALLSGASVHQMPDIDIDSVVPTRNGIWVKESLLRHPGGRILRGELQILVHFLSKWHEVDPHDLSQDPLVLVQRDTVAREAKILLSFL